MAKFTVTIDCSNDAFTPDPRTEVARILRRVAYDVKIGGLSGFFETIHDVNGNDVGRFGIKNDDGSNWNGPSED